jgi:hypothetical protein
MNPYTIEEVLRMLVDKAAALRFFADAAATNNFAVPDPSVFSGMADICGDIERFARDVRDSLSVEALSGEIWKRKR